MVLSLDAIISVLLPAFLLYIGYHLIFSPRKIKSTENFITQQRKKLSYDAEKLKTRLISHHRTILKKFSSNTEPVAGSLTLSIRMDAMTDNHIAEADAIDRAVSALEELFDVFIIAYTDSSEEAEQCTMKLAGSPYLASFRNKHRILLYQSPVAKIAFIRNIDPLIHIEYDEEFAKAMLQHVSMVLKYDARASPGESTGTVQASDVDGRIYVEIGSLSEILQLDLK